LWHQAERRVLQKTDSLSGATLGHFSVRALYQDGTGVGVGSQFSPKCQDNTHCGSGVLPNWHQPERLIFSEITISVQVPMLCTLRCGRNTLLAPVRELLVLNLSKSYLKMEDSILI